MVRCISDRSNCGFSSSSSSSSSASASASSLVVQILNAIAVSAKSRFATTHQQQRQQNNRTTDTRTHARTHAKTDRQTTRHFPNKSSVPALVALLDARSAVPTIGTAWLAASALPS
eukprot:6468071-Amphidinium_carterae.1